MARRLLNFLTVLSLLLCVAVVWLDVAAGGAGGDGRDVFSVYWRPLHGRYTLRAGPRGIRLDGSPAAPASERARAASLVARMRDEQIKWDLTPIDNTGEFIVERDPDWGPDSPHRQLEEGPVGARRAALLEALEDPGEVIVVHWHLHRHLTRDQADKEHLVTALSRRRPDGSFLYEWAGLRVDLTDVKETTLFRWYTGGFGGTVHACRASYDPSQLPALRARWHRRLDEPVVAMRYPACLAGAAALPGWWCAAWFWRTAHRRRERRLNRCVNCGYDLRATSGRCPECGTRSAPAPPTV